MLIIDDNQDFAENLTEILEVEGATVRHADCVARSHDELAQFQPNVAFVDLRLPDGSGEDLLLEMSRSVPDCLCIVLTGNASIQSAIMAVERGAFGFLIKDMPVEAVIASYRRAGERLALEDQARLLEARLAHQEQLAMIGQMAATLAHEIRNPLTGIRQALEVILEATGEPPGMEGIKVSMLERLKRLHELVDDLLRFARPVTVEKRSVDVQELVDQVIHEVERDSQTYGAKFEIQIDDSVRRWPVDSNHFHLLLRNLIENGVLAMEKSELRVLDIRAQRV
ncbi:MAG: response regulator, partial [Planctomycetes bacterium]|nr:response regulator [Planctomycetota bacterium]